VVRPKPVAAANSSACGHSSAVGLTPILDREQFFLLFNQSPACKVVHKSVPAIRRLRDAEFIEDYDAAYYLQVRCNNRKSLFVESGM